MRKSRPKKDLSGMKVGRLTVVGRLEISKSVKLEVYKRAGGPDNLVCEGCGFPIGGKRFDYDHKHPEFLQNAPKSERTITADDVQLLGYECCHKAKSIKEVKANAHGKRIITKAAKARKKKTGFWKPDNCKFNWRTGKYERGK